MITFQHIMHSRMGLHARPASDLSTLARTFESTITIYAKKRSANAKRIVDLMEMNVRYKEVLTFEIKGRDEGKAYMELKQYCEKHL